MSKIETGEKVVLSEVKERQLELNELYRERDRLVALADGASESELFDVINDRMDVDENIEALKALMEKERGE